jgi:hypothetical protein
MNKVQNASKSEYDWIYFQFTKFFQSRYGPGVEAASNRNEYKKSFWMQMAVGA